MDQPAQTESQVTAGDQTQDQTAPPRLKLKRSVVLVGMMGAGKTAVGRALSQRLGVPFLDSDAAIEEAAKSTIAEIFARDGEAFFRDRETEVIGRLMAGPAGIISTGGGAFMKERNRQLISDKGVSVWLDVDLQVLWERVRHKDTRPLLRTPNPRATLAELFEARVPIYRKADLQVQADASTSIDETASRVIDVLRSRADVMETE